MCGIAGVYFKGDWDNKEKFKVIRKIYTSIEHRGIHATGFADVKFNSQEPIRIRKSELRASLYMDTSGFQHNVWGDFVLLHTRYATHGDPKEMRNNHPHTSEDFIMIHNGVVWNKKLADYNYYSECDSEIALSYIQRYGVVEGLTKLKGDAAIALISKKEPRVLYLYHDGRPIVMQEHVISRDKYALIFSSEGIDFRSIGIFFSVPEPQFSLEENILYKINLLEEKVERTKIKREKSTREFPKSNYVFDAEDICDEEHEVKCTGSIGLKLDAADVDQMIGKKPRKWSNVGGVYGD